MARTLRFIPEGGALVEVTCREAWRELREASSQFLAAFRTAAAKLKAGDRASPFPIGSFPPALPFVAA